MREVGTTDAGMTVLDVVRLLVYSSENGAPEVIVEEIPANRRATAKITEALFPSNGASRELACSSSVTGVPVPKNAAAASRIMALLNGPTDHHGEDRVGIFVA